jgi:hypothetical protein
MGLKSVSQRRRLSRGCRLSLVFTALALPAWALWRPVALNYDTAYALMWGRQILSDGVPDYTALGSPTPHPLLAALAAPAALAGEHVYVLLSLLGCLSWGVLVYATYRLCEAAGSAAAGWLAGAILASSGLFLGLAATAAKDVPYVALIVIAAALEVRTPRRGVPVLVLLALAGLIRPEAWLLSGLYWLYVRRGLSAAHSLGALAIAAAAPSVWASTDLLVTGHPAFSFNFTRDAGEALSRPTGARGIADALTQELPDLVTWPVVVGSGMAAVTALRTRKRAWLVPAAIGLAATGAIAAQGLTGLPLTARLLLLLAAALVVLFALAAVAWFRTRRWLVVLLGLGFLASLPGQLDRLADLRADLVASGRVYEDLREVMYSSAGESLRGCAMTTLFPFAVDGATQVPYLAYAVYRGKVDRIRIRREGVPAEGGLVLLRSGTDLASRGSAADAIGGGNSTPAGFDQLVANESWAAFARNC